MAHTGTWQGRTRMAWATWWLGAAMIAGGAYMDNDKLFDAGSWMIMFIVGTMITGKVVHDKFGKA